MHTPTTLVGSKVVSIKITWELIAPCKDACNLVADYQQD